MIVHVAKYRVCASALLMLLFCSAIAVAQTASVVDVTPPQNSLNVSPSAEIVGEFDSPLDETTVQESAFTAFGDFGGRLSGTVTYSDAGSQYLVTFDHSLPFRVGERVQASLSSQIHGGSPFSPIDPFVWQFKAQAAGGSGTFGGLTNYSVPSGSWTMIPLDIDNDLNIDLVVTSKYSSMIGIFWSKGDGTFFGYQGQNTISYPIAINAADLNGDGFQDLMVFGQTWDSLAIMLNTGHATFDPYYSVWMGHAYPFEVDAADLDGDGDLDVMAAAVFGGDSVVVCFNDGTGAFPAMYSSYPTGGTSPAVARPADVDNDGDMDIVVVHGMSANIAVLLNSEGSFGAPILYALPQGGLSLEVVDVTGDGYVDAIVAPTAGNQLIVLNNNGDGTFAAYDTYEAEDGFSLVKCADMDADGDQDIVATYQGSDFVSVFINDNGSFNNRTSYPTLETTDWVAVADFDGDYDLDLAFTMGQLDSMGIMFNADVPSTLAVADAQPAPHSVSVPASAAISVAFTTDVDMATVNNSTLTINSGKTGKYSSTYSYDGLDRRINCNLSDPLLPGDLITVTVTGGVKATNGDSVTHGYSWSFTTATQPAAATSFRQVVCSTSAVVPFDVKPIDFDLDYDADIAVAGYQISVIRNDGSLSFDEQSVDTLTPGSFYISTADLNGDGYPDIVSWFNQIESDSDPFGILINNGDGTFTGDTLFPNTAWYVGIAPADFDNDGDIDLAATDGFGGRRELVFWNNGNAQFTADTVADLGYISSDGEDPCVTDLDNDGLIDILMLNWSEPGFTVIHNDGGSFSIAGTYFMGNYSERLAASDLNGDHYPDVVGISNSLTGPLSVVFSDGSGGFNVPMIYDLEGDRPLDVELADIDGDGDNDVILGSYSNGVGHHTHILFNDGTGALSPGLFVSSPVSPDQLCSADFDSDGDLDLAVTSGSETIIVLVNSDCHDYDHDGFSDPGWPGDECAADNCPLLANPLQEDADMNGIGDACQFSETVIQGDPTVDVGAGVEVTFSNVLAGGTVDMTITTDGPTAPGGYTLVPSAIPTYYDLTTNAGTSDPVTVCITYDDAGMAPVDEEAIVLLHWDGIDWVDITSSVDTVLNIVCGITPSLSPFIVAIPQTSCCGLYTGGFTGNTNCDSNGIMNLQDITRLIDRIYLSRTPLCCEEDGNVNGDSEGVLNLQDITALIDHIYLSKNPTATCP